MVRSASPEPAATDFAAQEANQFSWETQVDGPFIFALRAELEARAGGNPSWNTGVDYKKQLENSSDLAEVRGLYAQAGLSLDADLATLNSATRIAADPNAVAYLTQNIVFNGDLHGRPVLTLHTTGDGLVVNQDEEAYRSVVKDAKDSKLLRQAFVHRAGHCTFTPAETISAFEALVARIDTGKWKGTTDPDALNAAADALGPTYTPPARASSASTRHPPPPVRPRATLTRETLSQRPGRCAASAARCAYALRTSIGTISSARMCVAPSTTGGAQPARCASSHRSAQTHQRSPGASPANPHSGLGVERSLPARRLNSRNSSLVMQQTVWLPTSSGPVAQQPSR